jgi:hypothetical protein
VQQFVGKYDKTQCYRNGQAAPLPYHCGLRSGKAHSLVNEQSPFAGLLFITILLPSLLGNLFLLFKCCRVDMLRQGAVRLKDHKSFLRAVPQRSFSYLNYVTIAD